MLRFNPPRRREAYAYSSISDVMDQPMMSSTRTHLAVLLPPAPGPGLLAGALALVRVLSEECNYRVSVGMPTAAIDDWEEAVASFRASATAVVVRPLTWTELSRDVAERMFGSG